MLILLLRTSYLYLEDDHDEQPAKYITNTLYSNYKDLKKVIVYLL